MVVAVSVALSVGLLGGAFFVRHLIFANEPEAQQEGATRRAPALVEVVRAERGMYRPVLEVLGRVEASRDIELRSQVAGRVISIERAFTPGALVRAGEALLRLNPADYEPMVAMRESELRRARAQLEIERGLQRAAKREYELLGEEIDDANRALVLREPQIASSEAQVAAAEAALRLARLDLDRTTITAPFDAQILSRDANLGSQLSTNDVLGRLVGSNEYWVRASVPLRDLQWIRFESEDGPASSAVIRMPSAWGSNASRAGAVARLVGTLDEESRLAEVLITVSDPLAKETSGPRMILDAIVQVEIEGRPIDDVVRLERDYLRQRDTVWVKANEKLSIRDVEVVYRDAQYAYLKTGVEAGEMIVTTSLATVRDGLDLRLAENTASPAGSAAVADGDGAR